jgi:hypothetical protein
MKCLFFGSSALLTVAVMLAMTATQGRFRLRVVPAPVVTPALESEIF